MLNFFTDNKNNFFSISLILVLVFSRLIPHPPNFTPIISVALMSGLLFKKINVSFLILLMAMLISDVFIGFYENMIFVYLSLAIITYVSYQIALKINFINLFLFSTLSALIFYFISNFGVWLQGNFYEKNLTGLFQCYIFAIPFFKNTLISTIFFTYLAYCSKFFYNKWKVL